MMHPTLWRVVVLTLTIACLANILLWKVSNTDDAFANIVAIASGVAAAALIATYFVFVGWLREALLLTFVVWTANTIEFATEDAASWEARVRQSGFYGAFALLALGGFIAIRSRSVEP